MEKVRKTFFDPLARSKAQISTMLHKLPVGSAHPFSLQDILLCRTETGIKEIDISGYSEEYFYSAVDLGNMGDVLLRRMAGFKEQLGVFDDFEIVQAPAATFKVSIEAKKISLLVVSELTPTYYDFCLADQEYNACCWNAQRSISGIRHSGDVSHGPNLLQYVTLDKASLTTKPVCVFISGYDKTRITRFLGTDPALLVANHADKILYIVPVPLDAATIGDATICCPLVIKRDGDSLICSILSAATTDRDIMCHGRQLESPCFPEAIARANLTVSALEEAGAQRISENRAQEATPSLKCQSSASMKRHAVLTTNLAALPSFLISSETQLVRFGTGLEFVLSNTNHYVKMKQSSVVLPCIFGTQLQGPVILATGTTPLNVPFGESKALCDYYEQLDSIVVVVDERMTDNARNLASNLRVNALFIVQLHTREKPDTDEQVASLLSSTNINAVTALAGPQSLILVSIADRFYFYRGLANPRILNTSKLAFGADITSIVQTTSVESLLVPKIPRLINLEDENIIILPFTSQFVQTQGLREFFHKASFDRINTMDDDIAAVVPQLQALMNQKDLQQLSKDLLDILSAKIDKATAPLRREYIEFVSVEFNINNKESILKKNRMLGQLRKMTKETQSALEPVISNLANMMSSQTTSTKTHDIKRLVRKTQIQNNVEATKSMTFDTLTGLLEQHAQEMGVMLLKIETEPYEQLLSRLKDSAFDARSCCKLDSRILHLDGFDAGIIMQQSQSQHSGPLKSQAGPCHPTLALPYLSQGRGPGSMLAWVCWDEFVNLKSPYHVRWVEKCNESHIAALRIMMRDTLSCAVASRQHSIGASSPETGQLMSSLLMAAMSKLAGMRTTAPVVIDNADDTVIKLMRGLFGNLMTIAGSGVRPLSMVWQLFGVKSLFDIPVTDADWVWYERVVELYPYTGWPLEQFHDNLGKLLDKIILRVVTRNENTAEIKASRVSEMIRFCKLRNIQLENCRTIITTFERMLATDNVDIPAVAARLLHKIPKELEKQTRGYTRMVRYIEHLAKGGQRHADDDLVYASVYTKRSAAFKDLKTTVANACLGGDWATAKANCQAILDKHQQIALTWHIKPEKLKIQNLDLYRELIDANLEQNVGQYNNATNKKVIGRILNDAELRRVPWQVGKDASEKDIEPLDEQLLDEVLTGKRQEPVENVQAPMDKPIISETLVDQVEFSQFRSSLAPSFISAMEKALSAEDVCRLLNVPVAGMRIFIQALNPDFVWEDLGQQFRVVVLDLLRQRSSRAEQRPSSAMLML
ncbi:hypothetical protein F66182_2421 [Fusarium sp. NRRL 66182]|nr:hypothetical protein F66182_2421 [Fusarium sp. NRRL 66182]